MHRRITLSLVVAFCLTLLPMTHGVAAVAPAAAPDVVPRFEGAKCPFALKKGEVEGLNVECGFVVVRERHGAADGATIRLAVARWKAQKNPADPEPVIFLQGGPGGRSLGSSFVRGMATMFTGSRDYIAFDQRGTGRTEPSLDCPEVTAQGLKDDTQRISIAEAIEHETAAELACKDRLVGQGIDLTAYDSTQNAADVNDIRAVFGYQKVNLLGISYGTRLGLTVLRDYPDIVRSAVLDSVSPLSVNSYEEYAVSFDRAINLLFGDCTTAAACGAAYPTLRMDFSRVYAQLNMQPATVTITDPNTKAKYDIIIDGPRFLGLIHDALYDANAIGLLPALIGQVKEGKRDLLQRFTQVFYWSTSSVGMGIAVRCNEYLPFSDRERALAALQPLLPEVREAYGPAIMKNFSLCPQWPTKQPNPADHQPVVSDVPTLVLESANDPTTPPAFGKRAAETLSRGFYIETPGIGHSVIANGGTCAEEMVKAFIADPGTKPQAACTANVGVTFTTP